MLQVRSLVNFLQTSRQYQMPECQKLFRVFAQCQIRFHEQLLEPETIRIISDVIAINTGYVIWRHVMWCIQQLTISIQILTYFLNSSSPLQDIKSTHSFIKVTGLGSLFTPNFCFVWPDNIESLFTVASQLLFVPIYLTKWQSLPRLLKLLFMLISYLSLSLFIWKIYC